MLRSFSGPKARAAAEAVSAILQLALGAILVLGLVAVVAPPQDLPWRPLRLSDPIGLATGYKLTRLADHPKACLEILSQAGVSTTPVAPQRNDGFCVIDQAVRLTGGVDAMAPARPMMRCPLAAAYVVWDRQVLRPASRSAYGAPIVRVETFGVYACRRMYHRADAPPSEHARADAVDVSGFVLADGHEVSVERGWYGTARDRAFLRRVRAGACRVFGTTLSPDFNAEHHNHLHLDMGPLPACR